MLHSYETRTFAAKTFTPLFGSRSNVDVRVSWCGFDVAANLDVRASWCEFNPLNYEVSCSWLEFNTLARREIPGGGISHKRPQICVISVDGQDYRVHLDNVYAFLERKREESAKPKVRKGKSKKALVKKPPKIVLKSVPYEYKAQIQASVDWSNEILRKLWEGSLTRLINEAEQEEALALVLLMED